MAAGRDSLEWDIGGGVGGRFWQISPDLLECSNLMAISKE